MLLCHHISVDKLSFFRKVTNALTNNETVCGFSYVLNRSYSHEKLVLKKLVLSLQLHVPVSI